MVPKYPAFKSIEISDLVTVEKFLSSSVRKICELSFANHIIWKDDFQPYLTLINGNLCSYITPTYEPPFFIEPLGSDNLVETVDACLRHCGRLSRVSADFVAILPAGKYRVRPQREHFDYIYSAGDLVGLKGRRYDGKRNHIKKMKNAHPDYRYADLHKENFADCLKVFDTWSFGKRKLLPLCASCKDPACHCQRKAFENAFAYFDELKLMGGMIYVGGQPAAVAIASQLNSDTVCMHFLYCVRNIPGLHQTMLWEVCRRCFSGFWYVNFEQDLGDDGLRRFKNSYHPLHFEEKYLVELNPTI